MFPVLSLLGSLHAQAANIVMHKKARATPMNALSGHFEALLIEKRVCQPGVSTMYLGLGDIGIVLRRMWAEDTPY